ncbi:DUF4097 family beta strand repeat-containing protein [Georgenia alba]|uniref:DUF4097 domain-containing protein n=1 Tax=Georgenia alba TaxID=2233858 RepID=A0ABW2QEH5_9MICO
MATRSWIVPGPSQHEITDVARLRVQLVAGAVEVRTHDAPHVWVDVTDVSGNPLEMTVEGDRLTIGYPAIGWDGWVKRLTSYSSSDSARLTVHVPAATETSVATASAAVAITDVAEDLRLNTAAGSVEVTGCHGAATIRSASGRVTVTGQHGPVTVSTAAGRARVDGDVPRASVTTVAGAVEVTTTAETSKVDVATVSGAMRVVLPPGTGVSLSARTVSGAVRLDGQDRKSTGFGATTIEERTEGGICFLGARSVSGDLDVTRVAPALPGS